MTDEDRDRAEARRAAYEDALLSTFTSAAGRIALAGLAMQVGMVLPPSATDGEIRYREGQRALIADIQRGMAHARSRRAGSEQPEPKPGRRRGRQRAARPA